MEQLLNELMKALCIF